MIKAAAGGGGAASGSPRPGRARAPCRGERRSAAAFGDGGALSRDASLPAPAMSRSRSSATASAIHLFERECSLQRRRQKVWEEAPRGLSRRGRGRRSAPRPCGLRQSVGYRGAGTLEYLYDETTGEFFFIEMNTRIQVEHPVTEMITGVDLVSEMLRIAGGERLPFRQADIAIADHAIECRINAEDPANGISCLPPARITRLISQSGEGVRFDTMLYRRLLVPPFYDLLLGKLIVMGKRRATESLGEAGVALRGSQIEGFPRLAPLHRALLRDPDVRGSAVHTRWLEAWLPMKLPTIGNAACSARRGRWRMSNRYSFGGDDTSSSRSTKRCRSRLSSRALSMTNAVRESRIKGVTEICPANASYPDPLRSGFDRPDDMMARVEALEAAAENDRAGDQHAHHRSPGFLQRSLDARDADALSRAPPGLRA